MIPALVLTAGLATRLRPLSRVRAKAAMPVAGEALVRRILRWLAAAGTRDAVLNLHHLPHTIARVVGDGADVGVKVRYSWETPILGSAGGPRLALPLLDARTFLVVNGDTLTDLNLESLIVDHHKHGADVTMAVIPNTQPDKYGSVLASDDGVFTGVAARGTAAPLRDGAAVRSALSALYHFVGVQVVNASAFASLQAGTAAESIASLYPALIRTHPGSVRVFVTEAEFFDIGTPADYLETARQLAAREGVAACHGADAWIHSSAEVVDSILWEGVRVEKGASLVRCVVADGVRIPERSSWTDMMLRRAEGELEPGEQRVGDLAVAPLVSSLPSSGSAS